MFADRHPTARRCLDCGEAEAVTPKILAKKVAAAASIVRSSRLRICTLTTIWIFPFLLVGPVACAPATAWTAIVFLLVRSGC